MAVCAFHHCVFPFITGCPSSADCGSRFWGIVSVECHCCQRSALVPSDAMCPVTRILRLTGQDVYNALH